MTLWSWIKKMYDEGWSPRFTEWLRKHLAYIAMTFMFIAFVLALAILLGVVIFH